jgi:tripartite-type tricarboxylate transporter receptor subunit TctC
MTTLLRKAAVRRLSALFAFAGLTVVFQHPGHAQSYPTKPIRLVIPVAAGGGGDISVRLMAEPLSALLGQQVVVENRPGTAGIAAAQTVAGARPDGYTLALLANINAIGQSMVAAVPYDLVNDFIPIATVAFTDVVVFTSNTSRFGSLKDLIAEAKARPEAVTIGIGLIGTTQHLTAELFKAAVQTNLTIVPFRSTPNLAAAITRGDVDAGFELVAPIIESLGDGRLRPLAVSSGERFAGLSQVPTFLENGIPGSVTSWSLVAAPARTPAAIIERLNHDIVAALATADVQARYAKLGFKAGGGTPQQAKDLLVAEIARWQAVIAAAKIEKQ